MSAAIGGARGTALNNVSPSAYSSKFLLAISVQKLDLCSSFVQVDSTIILRVWFKCSLALRSTPRIECNFVLHYFSQAEAAQTQACEKFESMSARGKEELVSFRLRRVAAFKKR